MNSSVRLTYYKERDEYAFSGYHLEGERGTQRIEMDTILTAISAQLEQLLEQQTLFGKITITIEVGTSATP